MGKDSDREYALAVAEMESIRAHQRWIEHRRELKRQKELALREQLKREIAQIRWRS